MVHGGCLTVQEEVGASQVPGDVGLGARRPSHVFHFEYLFI